MWAGLFPEASLAVEACPRSFLQLILIGLFRYFRCFRCVWVEIIQKSITNIAHNCGNKLESFENKKRASCFHFPEINQMSSTKESDDRIQDKLEEGLCFCFRSVFGGLSRFFFVLAKKVKFLSLQRLFALCKTENENNSNNRACLSCKPSAAAASFSLATSAADFARVGTGLASFGTTTGAATEIGAAGAETVVIRVNEQRKAKAITRNATNEVG